MNYNNNTSANTQNLRAQKIANNIMKPKKSFISERVWTTFNVCNRLIRFISYCSLLLLASIDYLGIGSVKWTSLVFDSWRVASLLFAA